MNWIYIKEKRINSHKAAKKAIRTEIKRLATTIPFTRADAERIVRLELTVGDIYGHMKSICRAAWIVGLTVFTATIGLVVDLILK